MHRIQREISGHKMSGLLSPAARGRRYSTHIISRTSLYPIAPVSRFMRHILGLFVTLHQRTIVASTWKGMYLSATIHHRNTRAPLSSKLKGSMLYGTRRAGVFRGGFGELPGFLQDALSAGKPGWCVIIGGLALDVIVTSGFCHLL